MASLFKFWALLLLLIQLVFATIDLSRDRGFYGPLQLRLDHGFATLVPPITKSAKLLRRNYVFSTHITFKEEVSSISDGQLRAMAEDAMGELKEVLGFYSIELNHRNPVPRVMTILATDKEIFLSTSQKGSDKYAYHWKPSPVYQALLRCEASYRAGMEHYHQGSCGEIMAVHMWHESHVGENLASKGGRILTVEWQKIETLGDLKIKPPCGEDANIWGCNLFVKDFNLRVVPEVAREEYGSLEDISGGVAAIDQVKLACGPKPE